MDPKINEILIDLFTADPSLKEHEANLIKIITEYMEARPDTKFDKKFAAELRAELLKKAEEIKTKTDRKIIPFDVKLTRFAYGLAGATLVAVLAFGLAVSVFNPSGLKKSATGPAINFGGGIVTLGRNAFAINAPSANRDSATLGYGRGGGGGSMVTAEKSVTANLSSPSTVQSSEAMGGDADIANAKILPPEYTVYKYVYKGDDFTQDLPTVDIYRRAITPAGSRALADYITALDFDLFDLSKFNGADVANLTLAQNQEFGYTFTMDFASNQVSIATNYLQWPRPELDCKDEACYQSLQMTIDQIPPDDNIIALADDFLASFGIDKAKFGKPYIQKYWEYEIQQGVQRSAIYVPTEVSVIYPYVIEGQDVYDESGNPAGIYVGVNIKYNKGSSIYSIAPDTYEKSNYDAITDKAEIFKIAERGGLYPNYYYGEQGAVKEIALDTPRLALMRFYDYDQNEGKSSELYIPALIFPIKDMPADYPPYSKRAIAVPLAKTIYEKIGNIVGEPMPMPLAEEAAVDQTASGTETAQPNPADIQPPEPKQ